MGPCRCCLKSVLINQQGTSAMQGIVRSADSTVWRKKTLDDNLALLVAFLWPPFLFVSLPCSQFSVYFLPYLRQWPQSVPLWISLLRKKPFLRVMEGIKKGPLLGGHQKIILGHESNTKPQNRSWLICYSVLDIIGQIYLKLHTFAQCNNRICSKSFECHD